MWCKSLSIFYSPDNHCKAKIAKSRQLTQQSPFRSPIGARDINGCRHLLLEELDSASLRPLQPVLSVVEGPALSLLVLSIVEGVEWVEGSIKTKAGLAVFNWLYTKY